MKLALAVTVLAGCMTAPATTDDPSGGGGGGKEDGSSAACTTSYVEWLLGTYKPALAAKPIDAPRLVELTALAAHAPCRGVALTSTAYTSWIDVQNFIAFTPYFLAHADALPKFALATSPERGDYAAYLRNTAVTDTTRRAVKAIDAVRPIVTADGQDMRDWLAIYHAHLENALEVVFDLALLSHVEGYYSLNAGERDFLDLVATTRPTQTQDGAFAAWVDQYGDVLQHGVSIDSEDDYVSSVGCSTSTPEQCDRVKVLDRIKALAPAARDDADSTQWMWELSLWAPIAATAQPPFAVTDRAQLARIDAVRPAKVRGADAYKVWLSVVADVAGHADVMAGSVMPAKPCASGAAATAAFSAFRTENAALATSAIAPVACP